MMDNKKRQLEKEKDKLLLAKGQVQKAFVINLSRILDRLELLIVHAEKQKALTEANKEVSVSNLKEFPEQVGIKDLTTQIKEALKEKPDWYVEPKDRVEVTNMPEQITSTKEVIIKEAEKDSDTPPKWFGKVLLQVAEIIGKGLGYIATKVFTIKLADGERQKAQIVIPVDAEGKVLDFKPLIQVFSNSVGGGSGGGTTGGALEATLQLVLTQLQAINTNTDTLEIKADSINLNTDTLEALLADIKTYTDGLEGGVGAAADADAGTGNGSMIALLKNLRTNFGQLADATATVSSNSSFMAVMKFVRTRLDSINTNTSLINNTNSALGSTTDAEATGNGSVIAILKRIRTLLSGTLTIAGNVTATISGILSVKLQQTTNYLNNALDENEVDITTERAVLYGIQAYNPNDTDVAYLQISFSNSWNPGGGDPHFEYVIRPQQYVIVRYENQAQLATGGLYVAATGDSYGSTAPPEPIHVNIQWKVEG